MIRKYSKRQDIEHFKIGDIISVKIPYENRISIDNRQLFGRIPVEPYSHRYRIVTLSGIIKRLIPIEELDIIERVLWPDIVIPDTSTEVTLTLAAKKASTSERVGISCQCKGPCKSKRYKCYKEGKDCNIHCHRDDHDCSNLSSLVIHTEKALVGRPKRKRADSNVN
jgi:hypothetical protein